MKIFKSLAGVILAATLFMAGCKPKDADIKAAVEEKLKANALTSAAVVSVDAGVATLSGELSNQEAKAESEKIAASVKGVKSVVNNVSITPIPAAAEASPSPPIVAADDALTSGAQDAVKDFPGVTCSVTDGVITLTGSVSKADQRKIMMSVSSLKPKKIDNQLTVK